MPRPWTRIEVVDTNEGPLELRGRGEREFMILHAGRVLMTSAYHRSEVIVAELGCAPIRDRSRPRVLIGGAGLGFTLKAALDALSKDAAVTVAELNPVVLRWCAGPLAVLTDDALGDPRTTTFEGDVMDAVRHRGASKSKKDAGWDAVIIDLYIGPDDTPAGARHPLYGDRAIADVYAALKPGGCYAVWGEEHSRSFVRRLQRAGFSTRVERTSGPGPHHAVFVAEKP